VRRGEQLLYKSAVLMFLEALTPVHVGTGREEALHVDLPVQRDEFGFPTMWASSLKGAIKANIIDNDLKKHLGSEPGELETRPSHISILDAKLLLIPARSLDNVWIYVTTPHLLSYLKTYLDIYNDVENAKLSLDTSHIIQGVSKGIALSTKFSGRAFINETELDTIPDPDLLNRSGLSILLPKHIIEEITNHGLVILPDKDNKGLAIIRKSMVIQYRVKLKRAEKTVDTGPWSEEYVPIKTLFTSVALCRDTQDKKAQDLCNDFKNKLSNRNIYVGGKETIGRGLIKVYVYEGGTK